MSNESFVNPDSARERGTFTGRCFVLFLGTSSSYLCSSCFPQVNQEGRVFNINPDTPQAFIVSNYEKVSGDMLMKEVKFSNIIVMCFSLQSSQSLLDIMDKWYPILTNRSSSCSTLLVS